MLITNKVSSLLLKKKKLVFLLFFRKLTEHFKFIDKERIAIWGWSYGGYASAMALAQDEENVFACAAAVAPVTDWLYYGKTFV